MMTKGHTNSNSSSASLPVTGSNVACGDTPGSAMARLWRHHLWQLFEEHGAIDGVWEFKKKNVSSVLLTQVVAASIMWLNTSYSYTMYICIMFKIPKVLVILVCSKCGNLLTPWTASEPHCCLFGSHDIVAFRHSFLLKLNYPL